MNLEYTPEQITEYKDDNERRVRLAAREGHTFIDGMPLKVTMELTSDCDLFCKMCEFVVPRERGRKKGYQLDMAERDFEMLAPQVFPYARFVNLSVVGEPFLVPFLDRVVELCEQWQTRLEFITHGMHLDAAMIERIGGHTQCVVISFDGGTRETFNRIRVGSDFEVVTRNVMLFNRWRRSRPRGEWVPGLHFGVTLMRENVEELPTIVRVAHALGVDRVNCAWMIAFNDKMKRASCLNHKALANRCLERAQAVARELGVDLRTPAAFSGVSAAEAAAVEITEPELPEGPLPHLRDLLEGGGTDDLDAATARALAAREAARALVFDSSFQDQMGYSLHEQDQEATLGVNPTGGDSPAVDSAIQQTADERRLQGQMLGHSPSSDRDVPAEPPRDGARYTCKFLWNELFISQSGDVAPCCIQGRPVVGNIHQQDLASIWNGPAMQTMRKRLLEGDPIPCCRDCNYNTQLGYGEYRKDTLMIDLQREV
jgi:radical SAM protein with 4Fe4S-binding SPASM domain